MAQRRGKSAPAAIDPLSALGDDAPNDPLADLGGGDETPNTDPDPLGDFNGSPEPSEDEDPLAGLEVGEEPPPPVTVAKGVGALKGSVNAAAIRNSIPELADPDPLLLQGVQEIQAGMVKFEKLFKDFDKLQSCMVATNNFQHGLEKQLAELFQRADKVEAGQAAILGAIAELREFIQSTPAQTPPAASKPAADGSVTVNKGSVTKVDMAALNPILAALRARREKHPAMKLSLTANPGAVWDALSKLAATLGHTLSPKQVEEMIRAADLVQNDEVKF